MVGVAVLPIFIIPVKEDDIPRVGFIVPVLPQSPVLEPLDTIAAPGKLWNNPSVNISALIGAPTDKASTPLHARAKAVPRPVRLTAHITKLGERDRDDLTIAGADTVKHSAPHTAVALCQQFGKLLALVGVKMEIVCHFIGGLVADMDIERCPICGSRGLDDVPLTVVSFRHHCVRSSFRPGRYLVHLPEDIFQERLFGIVHGGHLLGIIRVGGGLDRIHRQHLLPHSAGAGHLQHIMPGAGFYGLQSGFILLIDFLHSRPHCLARAGVLTGEKYSEAGTDQQADQANDDDRHNSDPAASGQGAYQRFCRGDNSLHRRNSGLDRCLYCRNSSFRGNPSSLRRPV